MSTHYEVDKTIEQMRKITREHRLPADAGSIAHVVHRNREVSIQITKMFLMEANRGTEMTELLAAVANFAHEAFCNLCIRIEDPEMQKTARKYFMMRIDTGIEHFFEGGAAGFTVPVHSESGGHA